MSTITARLSRLVVLSFSLLALLARPTHCQIQETRDFAIVEGTVCDSQSAPLKDANVTLESVDHAHKFVTHSDAQGHYSFMNVPFGDYILQSSKTGYVESKDGPFAVRVQEPKIVDVHLSKEDSAKGVKDAFPQGQFSDEPKFQVAGIADPTNYGGHGSDAVRRTREALARNTSSLNKEASTHPGRDSASTGDTAGMHRRKGDAAESKGHSLEAVREYQLAAELQPSEPNLFAWGAELLLHRAFEPATEIFEKGQRLFPNSVRIAVGLSIATYDEGATQRGEQMLLRACDINPADSAPYLFMGQLQEAERIELPGWTEKLHRFSLLDPGNPMAHYYYAVALRKQSSESEDNFVIEAELKKAIALDPRLGSAYLQLGILYAAKKDNPAAIAAFEKAIENLSLPDEAHYRLAQIYRQTGEMDKARKEIALYNQISQQKTRKEEVQRHAIQQFVYTLRGQKPDTSAPDTKPH
jgi:tetratricopeptide (TPR) repeat protein